MKRRLLALGFAGVMVLGVAAPALAAKPGPGVKQCVPGQNSQPQGGKKSGAC